jgi:hypothetical protein
MSFLRACVLLGLLSSCVYGVEGSADSKFEDRFTWLAQWDVLDFKGDAIVQVGIDTTAPPGFGPEVLLVEGDHVLGLAKSVHMTEGTLVVLYRERDPRDRDADGILVFDAQYGDDLSVEHNTKLVRPMMWLELDNDTGVHIRAKLDETHEVGYAEQSGVGLVTDEWNKTNWIWQKLRIEDGKVFAKYWPAHQREPAEWILQTALNNQQPGRVGFRIGSGSIAIAYFSFSPNDIRPPAPVFYLVSTHERTICGQPFQLNLYCNALGRDGNYSMALLQGDSELAVVAIDGKQLRERAEQKFVIVPPGETREFPGYTVIESDIDQKPLRAVVRDSVGT